MPSKKKIFDITPPERELQIEKEFKKEKTAVFKPALKSVPKSVSPKNNKAPLFLGLGLLLAGVLSYFLIPIKANVEIWPKKENIEETITAQVALAQKEGNFIQGEILEIEKTVSQDFTASGKKLKAIKAQGIIRVYNNYSTSPQVLVATTRFVSNNGKLFRAPEKAVVPGGHYDGGKLVPGFVDIKVAADQPGEEYNIEPATFSIPGFAGTPKYTAFYAKSSEPMTGGFKSEVSQITQEDLNKAKEILTLKALAESNDGLKESASSKQFLLIDKAIFSKTADFQPSAKAGQETGSFSAQTKAATKALVFKESQLKDFSRNHILGKLLPGAKLIESSLKIEYSLETVNPEKNELILKLAIFVQSHSLLEEVQLKEMIKNKTLEEIKTILRGIPQIEKTKVELWPFWAGSAPDDLGRIKVVLLGVD